MTLTTRLAVLDPVPVREMFAEVRALLGAGPDVPIVERDSHGPSIEHPPDQGLAAWAGLDYSIERPMPTEGYLPEGTFAVLWLDTAYHGDPVAVHSRIVDAVGRWLDDRAKRWRWHDEFTGTWHDGPATGVLGYS